MRIVSLLPSATETFYALGLGNDLVGRSPEGDNPPEVAAKPVVSAGVFDGTVMGSAEIEATAVQDGRVFAVDGSAYFNRPGPRTVDSVQLLAHLIHPELFPEPWPDEAGRRFT